MLLVTGLCARNSPVKIGWFRLSHDDVIKWKHFPRHWPFVRGIHRSPVNSPHKGQWRGALMFYLICAWTNSWANNREAGDLGRHRAHYDVIVMFSLGYDCCQVTIGSNNSLKQNRRKSIFQTNDNLVQWCICQEFQALAVFRSIVIYKYIYIYACSWLRCKHFSFFLFIQVRAKTGTGTSKIVCHEFVIGMYSSQSIGGLSYSCTYNQGPDSI